MPPGVEFHRGGCLETAHAVHAAVADAGGRLLAGAGDPRLRTYWRSAAKPFQLVPFVAAGGLERYGLGTREVAVMTASHNAERPHREAATAVLRAAGLDEGDLRCGVHLPDAEAAWRDLGPGGRVTPLWNNCSGKHAGMLAYCRMREWPTEGYLSPDHPLQREILHVVAEVTGEEAGAIRLGVDGCGVPAFHLSLAGMATAYARLADTGAAGALEEPLRRIADAVSEEPFFVAGSGRLCTRVGEVTGGRVIAKVGAAGVFCAALRDQRRGVAVKVRDGSGRAAEIALVAALDQLGALAPAELVQLARFAPGATRNLVGTPVGEARATFRLDPRPSSP